ncbi:hypothetical protein NMY22_g11010 [Coprinellus aureogranulatus]|nr:hypothetical protein NMY22_g11010 [Coprinellus aureogranulatus]
MASTSSITDSHYDIVIVGAGIAGPALAHGLSQLPSYRRPLRIALIERSLAEPDRIVGELLQPGGVAALRELGLEWTLEGIDAVPVHGYCVVEEGKQVHIPYPEGYEGRSFHHGRFVMKLREAAFKAKGVDVIEATVTELIEDPHDSKRIIGVYATKKGEGLLESAPVIEKSEPIVEDAQETQPADEPPAPAAPAEQTLRPDSSEKGLKRKFLERGTSTGPPDGSPNEQEGTQNEQDDNNAEPSPNTQPNERTSPPSPKVPKLSGFMAYASTSSPFASVKGNALKSGSSTPLAGSSSRSGFAGAASPFAAVSREKSPLPNDSQSTIASPAPKRSGFESFSGTASPFAGAARSKSPPVLGSTSKLGRAKSPPRRTNTLNANPFGSYTSSGFAAALHAPQKVKTDESSSANVFGSVGSSSNVFGSRTGSVASVFGSKEKEDSNGEEEDGDEGDEGTQTSSFGERLRAAGAGEEDEEEDGKPKINLEAQDLVTGEEDEETILQVRGKLFALDGSSWKERGTGIIRLNVNREDGSSPRLIMRKDAVYTVLLNVTLFPGMKCVAAQDPRYVRFSVIEGGKTTHYNLKVSNPKIATEFLEEVNANIPSADDASSAV